MGTWKLDNAKSKLAPGMGKSTTVIYTQKGDKIQVAVDGVDKHGKPTHGVCVGKWDGKAFKATGNIPWDAAAYRVVNDYSNNIATMKNGKVAWTGTITVSKDVHRANNRARRTHYLPVALHRHLRRRMGDDTVSISLSTCRV